MSKFVVDASIILCWLLNEENNTNAVKLLQEVRAGAGAIAPILMRYEVANVMVMTHTRRKRLSKDDLLSGLNDFDNLPVIYDWSSADFVTTRISMIAENHGLTVYDSAYLELAQREKLPLATLDQKLKEAATRSGIELV